MYVFWQNEGEMFLCGAEKAVIDAEFCVTIKDYHRLALDFLAAKGKSSGGNRSDARFEEKTM